MSVLSSSVNSPIILAESECFSRRLYFKFQGANVKPDDDSIIGSFGVYKYTVVSLISLHLNYEHATVTWQLEQFLMKMDDVTGAM